MNYHDPLFIGVILLLLALVMITSIRLVISHKIVKAAASRYASLKEDFNTEAMILTYNLRGSVNMTNPCYVLACEEEIIFLSAIGSTAQWNLPYAQIISYKINYEHDIQRRHASKNFYLENVRSISFEYRNEMGEINSFYIEKTYQPDPREFNRYAFSQSNLYLYIKGKVQQLSEAEQY